jgi:hypothetical protein
MTLSEDQRRKMLHAIGGRLFGGHRNHYMAGQKSEPWDQLVDAGLATVVVLTRPDDVWYTVTDAGLDRLRAELPSDGRKAWAITFEGHGTAAVRARTRGAARYLAATVFGDAFDLSTFDALRQVRSVKRAPWADRRGPYGRDEVLTIEESKP